MGYESRPLTGKRVLIIGGAGGSNGGAITRHVAQAGASHVAIVDIDLSQAEKAAAGIAKTGISTRAFAADVRSSDPGRQATAWRPASWVSNSEMRTTRPSGSEREDACVSWRSDRLFACGNELIEMLDAEAHVLSDSGASDPALTHRVRYPVAGHVEVRSCFVDIEKQWHKDCRCRSSGSGRHWSTPRGPCTALDLEV